MAGRRLAYLATVASCFVFYIAYGQWLSWLILLTVLALPWFSLLLSLPAILKFRAAPGGPVSLTMGETGELWLLGSCPWPMPLFRGRIKIKRLITGESWYYQDAHDLETNHCGGLRVTLEAVKICDYLGLFAFGVRSREQKIILVRPQPVPMASVTDPGLLVPRAWKPKFGGGYAENHELRLYRPGDGLNQVHWKLSAKTGSLMIRESMEPWQGMILLTMNLRGSHDEIDRKLGRLLWLGTRLLEQDLRFQLNVLTADGILTYDIGTGQDLSKALDDLLCRGMAKEGDLRDRDFSAAWHCHIGGAPDEA